MVDIFAITRAILKDAPILLLDEATAYLDAANEQGVLAGMRAAMHGRTVIRITHRLVQMEEATEILVLDHGQIIERGTHNDLLAGNGRYATMWYATQIADVEIEAVPVQAAYALIR